MLILKEKTAHGVTKTSDYYYVKIPAVAVVGLSLHFEALKLCLLEGKHSFPSIL